MKKWIYSILFSLILPIVYFVVFGLLFVLNRTLGFVLLTLCLIGAIIWCSVQIHSKLTGKLEVRHYTTDLISYFSKHFPKDSNSPEAKIYTKLIAELSEYEKLHPNSTHNIRCGVKGEES